MIIMVGEPQIGLNDKLKLYGVDGCVVDPSAKTSPQKLFPSAVHFSLREKCLIMFWRRKKLLLKLAWVWEVVDGGG
jgi:hypothetical protein